MARKTPNKTREPLDSVRSVLLGSPATNNWCFAKLGCSKFSHPPENTVWHLCDGLNVRLDRAYSVRWYIADHCCQFRTSCPASVRKAPLASALMHVAQCTLPRKPVLAAASKQGIGCPDVQLSVICCCCWPQTSLFPIMQCSVLVLITQ